MSTYSLYRRIVLSEGFLYIVTLQPYLISHFISFSFCLIFYPYPNWITFYLVFSFGQQLLWWEGLFPFALWKCPPIILDKMLLFKMPFFKEGILNRSILSSGIWGHFWERKCEMPFCSFKNALLYSLIKCYYLKCPFRKGHFE